MKTLNKKNEYHFFIMFIIISFVLIGCKNTMSIMSTDKNVGMNGSFEFTENGVPVNWAFYTQDIVEKMN